MPNRTPPAETALLLFGHGTSDGGGSAIAETLAAEIRTRGVFGAVATAFARQAPSPAAALARLPQRCVLVVPLLASAGGMATRVLPSLLTDSAGQISRPRLMVLPPIGLDAEVHAIAADLAGRSLAEAGLDAARIALLVAGHGSTRRTASEQATSALVAALSASGRYGAVDAIYLEQPPLVSEWRRVTGFRDVVVVPLFVSGGGHQESDLPGLLRAGGAALDGRLVDGRRLWLTPAVGRHPAMADLILRRALAALKSAA